MRLFRRKNYISLRWAGDSRRPLKRLWHWHMANVCFFFCLGKGWISLSYDPQPKGIA